MTSVILVGFGGALGAMARYGVGIAGRTWLGDFPLATLLINVAGGFAMGLLAGALDRAAPGFAEPVRLFLGVGILGGFTTFSAFSLESWRLIEAGAVVPALAYVLASVLGSIVALMLGLFLARAVL